MKNVFFNPIFNNRDMRQEDKLKYILDKYNLHHGKGSKKKYKCKTKK